MTLLSLEISLASIFIANCLDSLKEKIKHCIRLESFIIENYFPEKVKEIEARNQKQFKSAIKRYNFIVVLQKNINHHFSKTLYFIISILILSVISPALILFQQKEKILVKLYLAINYTVILFVCLFPAVCNTRFINSVSILFL